MLTRAARDDITAPICFGEEVIAMPPLSEIEFWTNLLATFGSQLLSPLWLTIITGGILSYIPVKRFRFTWASALQISLFVSAAVFFLPQQLRPPSSDVAHQLAQTPAAPYPLFSFEGDDHHGRIAHSFICGSPGEWRSVGAHSSLDVDGNTVMATCPPWATGAAQPPAAK